jgi:hypothetical protein
MEPHRKRGHGWHGGFAFASSHIRALGNGGDHLVINTDPSIWDIIGVAVFALLIHVEHRLTKLETLMRRCKCDE